MTKHFKGDIYFHVFIFCVLLISVNSCAEKKKSDSEQEKYFAMAKVPPLTDFKYELISTHFPRKRRCFLDGALRGVPAEGVA